MLRLILVRYHFGIGIGMQCYCMLINLVENVIALNVECVCVFSPRARPARFTPFALSPHLHHSRSCSRRVFWHW